MFSRGQAALEYLMTYGWALIVVALAVGILVFIAAPPGDDFRCNSSDPNFIIKGHSFTEVYSVGDDGGFQCDDYESWGGRISVVNAKGQEIQITEATTEGYFIAFEIKNHVCIPIDLVVTEEFFNDPVTISAGETFLIGPVENDGGQLGICGGGALSPVIVQLSNWQGFGLGLPIRPCGGSGGAESFATSTSGQIILTYTNQIGLESEVTITCNGFPERA